MAHTAWHNRGREGELDESHEIVVFFLMFGKYICAFLRISPCTPNKLAEEGKATEEVHEPETAVAVYVRGVMTSVSLSASSTCGTYDTACADVRDGEGEGKR